MTGLHQTWDLGVLLTSPPRYLNLQLLTAERTWANAMSMKASHSADTKGISGKTKSQIVSKLVKGARVAENLAEALASGASGASSTDILEARAYAALLRGAAYFENRSWDSCLKNYAVARVIYGALSTSAKGDIYKDLLSETIDPSIRYAHTRPRSRARNPSPPSPARPLTMPTPSWQTRSGS